LRRLNAFAGFLLVMALFCFASVCFAFCFAPLCLVVCFFEFDWHIALRFALLSSGLLCYVNRHQKERASTTTRVNLKRGKSQPQRT
jgi:hypothetical protein